MALHRTGVVHYFYHETLNFIWLCQTITRNANTSGLSSEIFPIKVIITYREYNFDKLLQISGTRRVGCFFKNADYDYAKSIPSTMPINVAMSQCTF